MTSIRPHFEPDGASVHDWSIFLFDLIILVLTVYWLLSFFGKSIVSGIRHMERFINLLSVLIVVLIMIRFLT